MEKVSKDIRKLFFEILYCPISKIKTGELNECYDIIHSQNNFKKEFQLPEPWSGDIERAKILFISSNPGITINEVFPRYSVEENVFLEGWNDNNIFQFFKDRFVKNGGKIKIKEKEGIKFKRVLNWKKLLKRGEELVGGDLSFENIAITDVVHCKSKNEIGLEACKNVCGSKFLNKVIGYSNAKLIVIVGNKAKDMINDLYNKIGNRRYKLYGPVEINNVNRYFLWIYHTNARKKQKIGYYIDDKELKKIREIIG